MMHEFYILPASDWDRLVEIMNDKPDDVKAMKKITDQAEPLDKSELIQDAEKNSIVFDGRVFVKGKEKAHK